MKPQIFEWWYVFTTNRNVIRVRVLALPFYLRKYDVVSDSYVTRNADGELALTPTDDFLAPCHLSFFQRLLRRFNKTTQHTNDATAKTRE